MKPFIFACLTSVLAYHSVAAAGFPQAEISNSRIHAKLYLPDARQGLSAVIAQFHWHRVPRQGKRVIFVLRRHPLKME